MINNQEENIIKENIVKLLEEKFGNYSKYIILDRALPDLRDGLKPVQRRILYAMAALKINYKSPYKKSARIVGEVIGKYHPHGDSSVYEAMVRMCQDWKMRYPIVDMHGNKGSVDGDPAAAMRYTEVRLSEITELLLSDLSNNIVKFVPNFDDNEIEPVILPSKVPNLLMNGSVGIASGYSTNIPPHNIVELINATIYLLKNEHGTIDEILQIITGPDFPTGGTVIGVNGIRSMYETGKGSFIIRSNTEIQRTNRIIKIINIPYEVNKSELIRQIDDVSINKNIGIKSVIDMTNKDGLYIEIKLSSTSNPEIVLENLYKYTDLQKSYSANMVAISNNKPIQFTIMDYLNEYINYQRFIYTNKFSNDLKKAKKRLEIVEGLIKAVSNIDQIIKIIRASKNKSDAKNNLIAKFKFSELQAEAIVILRLYRLTNTDVNELKHEKATLEIILNNLKNILKSPKKLDKKIIKFLEYVKSEEGDIRKTTITDMTKDDIKIKESDLIDKKEVVFSITYHGYLKTVSTRSQTSNDYLKFGKKENDVPVSIVRTLNTNLLITLTSKGRYVIIPIYKINEAMWKDVGDHMNSFAHLKSDEKIIASIISKNISLNKELLVTTKFGKIKRINFTDLYTTRYNSTIRYIKLFNNDEVASVQPIYSEDDQVVIITEFGQYVKYSVDLVPTISLSAQGVTAVNMQIDDAIISGHIIHDENKDYVVVATNDGHMRKTKTDVMHIANTRTAKPRDVIPITKGNKDRRIVSSFVTKSTNDQINVIDDNGDWFVIDSRDLSVSEPDMSSKRKIKERILYATKNSFYNFAELEEQYIRAKKTKVKIIESNIEQTIQINTIEVNVEKASAKKVDKQISIDELIDEI